VIRVLKLGGRVQQAPALIEAISAAWERSPGSLVLVHGGGDEVTALQQQLGREAQFVRGRRVTSESDIAILRMALSGLVNKRLVAALTASGVQAVGISGEDGSLVSAAPIDAATMGRAGYPSVVDATLVRHLLAGGFLPVISPVARDSQAAHGGALNVNGDDAAAAIAAGLGADELLFVADVAGVLDGSVVLPSLDTATARALVGKGTVTSGMIAKIEAAERALVAGVAHVRIGDTDAIVNTVVGTRITVAAAATDLSPQTV
jgi:acetylglutamate kinase